MREVWPEATIYTSLYRAESTFPEFGECEMRTSPLDRLPVDRSFRNLFPLYPLAFRSFGRLSEDLVVSSSSGWAHAVRTRPDAFHAVYCYTPARWLYGGDYLGASKRQLGLRPFLPGLRAWDRSAARAPDLYIAISRSVRNRIKRAYGRDAPIVYPPVDVDRFKPTPRGERLLVVSRLLPYKRIDAVVRAATQAGIGLDVVGEGPAMDDLRRMAGRSVAFHGTLDDEAVRQLMQGARAVCVPGAEDFGIVPVEAQAAGKPVVALGAGGVLETVEDGFSGVFFAHHDTDSVLDAINRCEAVTTAPETLAERAERFSRKAFRAALLKAIEDGGAGSDGIAQGPHRVADSADS